MIKQVGKYMLGDSVQQSRCYYNDCPNVPVIAMIDDNFDDRNVEEMWLLCDHHFKCRAWDVHREFPQNIGFMVPTWRT